jgi:replication-associated recombination protein RarA
MPEGFEDRRYYEPTERGFEQELRDRLSRLKNLRKRKS